ncbi:MAG TPA: hypothetical protein VN647_08405, partial [Nitrospira sp.]|nr:hypothetical protein [Nitrospira sp.]
AGELAMHRHKYDAGITSFTDAVKLEEELPYTEPPFWPIPIRHYLGAALLRAGQPARRKSFTELIWRRIRGTAGLNLDSCRVSVLSGKAAKRTSRKSNGNRHGSMRT